MNVQNHVDIHMYAAFGVLIDLRGILHASFLSTYRLIYTRMVHRYKTPVKTTYGH